MIQTDESTIAYSGNNSTTTPYPVPFLFFVDSDLHVVVTSETGEAELVLNTDFTVTGAGDPNGGNIKTTVAVPVASTVTIFRIVPATQLTSYQEADAFPAKSHERALDKLTMLVQQALRGSSGDDAEGGNAFRLTEASGGINAVARINDSTLGIDAAGKAILRTSSDFMGWLGQTGTVWADDAERANTRGAFVGQMGIQLSNLTLYIATSTAPGAWASYLPGTGIVTASNGTPNVIHQPAGDLVGTTESQILANKTINAPTVNNPQGMLPGDVGLDQVDNTSDQAKPLSDADIAALALKQDLAEKAQANGYASLDSTGKIPPEQLPGGGTGGSTFKGVWNASTNTPTIPAAAVGNLGWFYTVNVAGSTNINGITTWNVGDNIISNGTVWQRVPVTGSGVSSVNTRTGPVTLTKADVGLSNVDNTSVATQNAAAATLTNKTIDGANNSLTVRLGSDVTGNLPVSRLNNGTGASAGTWWCGDNTWKQPPGTGDVSGPVSAPDGDVAVFQGTTGKLLKTISKPAADLVTGPATAVDGRPAVFSGTSGKSIRMSTSVFMPVGSVLDYAGLTEPPGWLFCDGRQVLQADYPALYSAIGTTYGAADPPLFIREAHNAANSGNTVTVTGFQSSGTNRLLLVWIYAFVTGDLAVNTITFNGVNLTRQIDWGAHTGTGIGEFSVWTLANPSEATADVVATFSKACTRAVISAQLYTRVNQTTPVGTAVGATLTATNSATSSVTVSSAEGDLVVDALLWSDTGTYTPTAPFQEEFYTSGTGTSGNLRGSQRPAAGAGATTSDMSWNRPTDKWSQIGIAIKPLSDPVFKLPDLRGRIAAGRDDMGGTSAGRMSIAMTGKTTSGSKTISSLADTSTLCIGMKVVGSGITVGTTIATIASATSITINEDAITTAPDVALRFGIADGVTLGSTGGAQAASLVTSQLPSHTHPVTQIAAGSGVASGAGYGFPGSTTGATGGSDRHNNTQPTIVLNKIINAGT